MPSRISFVFFLFLFLSLSSCGEEGKIADANVFNWPGWRGPTRNGISAETALNPDALKGALKPVWKARIGRGYSSVVINGDYLYGMGNKASQDTIYCLSLADGRAVWSYSYPCRAGNYPGPRSTPLIDGDRLYAMSQDGRVFCLKARTGEEIWLKDVAVDFKAFFPFYGFASSPMIKDDYLLLNANEYGIALNKLNGELIWSSPQGLCGYASPVLYRFQEKDYVLFFGEKNVYGVELASGKLAWRFAWTTEGGFNIADPLFVDNKVFITSNYKKGCALLELTAGEPRLLWSNRNMESHFSGVIYLDGYVYGNSGDATIRVGAFECLDIKTGQVKWAKKHGIGSLILVGDAFIFLTETGNVYLAKADPAEYRQLAAGWLPQGVYFTPPTFCRGRLYIRNLEGDLFCIDASK